MSEPIVHDFEAFQRINALQFEMGELRKIVQGGGPGGSGEKRMSDELTNYKIAAAEARSDTKIVRLECKIDNLVTSIENLGSKIENQRSEASSNRNVLIGVMVGSALTIVALVFAMISYGASTFYNGTVVRDIVHNEISASKTAPSISATPAH